MAAKLSGHRVKPTLKTKFHIDYDWWEQTDQDLRIHMISQLSNEQQEYFAEHQEGAESDWVDPETAEVHRVDALRMALQEAASDPAYFQPPTSLVNAVFRVFLTNNNVPLTPEELADRIGRPAKIILRTLAGARVYKGIRPYVPSPSTDS